MPQPPSRRRPASCDEGTTLPGRGLPLTTAASSRGAGRTVLDALRTLFLDEGLGRASMAASYLLGATLQVYIDFLSCRSAARGSALCV